MVNDKIRLEILKKSVQLLLQAFGVVSQGIRQGRDGAASCAGRILRQILLAGEDVNVPASGAQAVRHFIGRHTHASFPGREGIGGNQNPSFAHGR